MNFVFMSVTIKYSTVHDIQDQYDMDDGMKNDCIKLKITKQKAENQLQDFFSYQWRTGLWKIKCG